MPKATVVISTFNRSQCLIKALESFLDQGSRDYQILVIDQNPNPDVKLLEFIQNHSERVKHIYSLTKGLAAGRNAGFRNTPAEIVIFCDDDTIAEPGLIRAHIAAYSDPAVGGVAGRVFTDSDKPVKKGDPVGKLRLWDGKVFSNFNADFPAEVDHVWGCNMSFRRELLERVGGFDERLIGTSSFDDADMALRIKKLGYKIVFSPQACLKHVFADKGGCRDMDFAEKMYWYYRNLTILYLKYMKRIFLPLVLLRQCIGVCRRSLASRDCKTFLFSTMGLICGFRDFKNKLRLRDIDRKTVKKILLTRTQGMGDVICFIPLLKTLRKEFPQASITLVTGRPGGREIMQGCPFVDKVVFYDVEKTRSVLGKVDFIIKLRKEKFDLLITSSQEVGFALKAFLSGAKYRLGFREYETNNIKSRDKFWFLHTVALEPLKSEHEVDANLRLLDILGIEEKDNSLSIWIRQEDEIFAKDLFKEYDLIHKPVIAISPFAGRAVKNWPKERYAELISDLEKNKKARVILIGPRYTLGGNEEIIRLGATESLNLSGRTTIGQLIALLSRCDLFIGSDSGPMNIAAALNIPVIALFGPGDENRYRPRCDHSLVINKRLECAPCNKQACERPRCMELISVNEVLKEVGHLLAKISKKQSR